MLIRSPQDKAVGYTIVLVLCAIVLSFVIGAVLVAIFGALALTGVR